MMPDSLLLYPEDLPAQDVVARIQACLSQAEFNKDVWLDARMDWRNFIQRACWEYGVHPALVLIGLQRERSLFGQQADEKDFDFAMGVVGQDAPGTSNERWNGLPNQIFLAARTFAWLGNIGPASNFGYRPGLHPSKARWADGSMNEVQLYGLDSRPAGVHYPATRMEYVQLCFTPHLEVLDTNEQIYDRWFKRYWE